MASRVSELGYGDARAPVGTQGWARRWRVEFFAKLQQIDLYPEGVESMLHLGTKFEAWKLLTDQNGEPFKNFEDCCRAPNPYGLQCDPARIKILLEQLHGKQAVQLVTVPPAQTGNRYSRKGHDVPLQDEAKAKLEKRLRSILRAPAEIQELYKDKKVSQTLAAKLGPKKPTEEQLATQSEVVLALREIPRERKAVDAKIRQVLGQKKLTVVEQAARLFSRMTAAQKTQFLRLIKAN